MVLVSTIGVVRERRSSRQPAGCTPPLWSPRNIAHAGQVTRNASDVSHLSGCAEHGHDTWRGEGKILSLGRSVRISSRSPAHGRRVRGLRRTAAAVRVSIMQHRELQERMLLSRTNKQRQTCMRRRREFGKCLLGKDVDGNCYTTRRYCEAADIQKRQKRATASPSSAGPLPQ